MTDAQPPLTWEGSASSNPIVSDTLPDEVITCLQNSRFLHLATALNNRPHVSLMNYTYLPTHPFTSHPTQLPLAGPLIIMTSNPASKKTLNLLQNHNVSLLVHDWVSSRPPHLTGERERSPTGGAGGGRASSLANMLMQMNSAAVSSISATMNGEAMVLEAGTEEEKWCREQHLLNNTFEAGGGGGGGGGEVSGSVGTGMVNGTDGPQAGGQGNVLSTSPSSQQPRSGDGGRSSYIEDQDVRVVVVTIRDGRISDWKGGVKDFVLSHAGEDGEGGRGIVNGVGH
ncbi:hypothetical protein KC338_g973 [Hortaea werneckii]|nr:hypothetical protein KC338_g973 [Hortaea werneckii]